MNIDVSLLTINRKPVIGKLKPDLTCYLVQLVRAVLTITCVVELKLPSSNHIVNELFAFTDAEVGQAVDYGIKVLRKNPLRPFIFVVLSDGTCFQLYKVKRTLLEGNVDIEISDALQGKVLFVFFSNYVNSH